MLKNFFKMKRLSGYFFFFVASILLSSCGASTEGANSNSADSTVAQQSARISAQTSERVDSATITGAPGEDTIRSTSKNFQLFVSLYRQQLSCTASQTGTCADPIYGTPTDCSSDYCGNDDCTRKITCCHRISETTFNELTVQRTLGHAEFSAEKFHDIVDQADCFTQYIRLRAQDSYYYLARVNSMTTTGGDPKSYYSVALMQGIANNKKGLASVVLYRGQLVDDGGVFRKIVPFQVNYKDNTVEYFDVSNDHP